MSETDGRDCLAGLFTPDDPDLIRLFQGQDSALDAYPKPLVLCGIALVRKTNLAKELKNAKVFERFASNAPY